MKTSKEAFKFREARIICGIELELRSYNVEGQDGKRMKCIGHLLAKENVTL